MRDWERDVAQAEREKAYNDIIAERDALKKESAIISRGRGEFRSQSKDI